MQQVCTRLHLALPVDVGHLAHDQESVGADMAHEVAAKRLIPEIVARAQALK